MNDVGFTEVGLGQIKLLDSLLQFDVLYDGREERLMELDAFQAKLSAPTVRIKFLEHLYARQNLVLDHAVNN